MLCINNQHTDANFNLAAEEYLFKNFSSDVFMLWQNNPSVIIGKHQEILAEVNLEFLRENRIPVARRISGGGAVYHDLGTINMTYIESGTHPDFSKFIRQILDILLKVGIHAQSNERHALFIDGLKISGSAQYIRKNKLLFHATLLFSTNLAHLYSTLNSQNTESENDQTSQTWRYVKSVKSPVTNIREHLSGPLSINDFKSQIIEYYMNNNPTNSIYTFSDEDIKAITRLKKEKYATKDWIFQN